MNAEALPAGGADEGRMTLMEHMVELRRRLIVSITAICLAGVVGWFLYPWVSDFLLHPYQSIASKSIAGGNLIATSPVEGFAVRIRITMYVAIAFAMPVILWQIWRFVSPGLYRHERRYALPFIASALALFSMGAGIAYWTLPKALEWLSNVGGNNITQAYTADKYFQLIAYMMLAFGICFEFPILLIFLQMAGIVSNQTLRKYWRHAIVIIAVVVAVATPSNDPISMLALSVPLWLFYGVAVLFGAARE
ncbi:MAG TPA: twin-arginine translocase subunit TatC, partial [Ilumatobacteraceae bacterium]|nr:twin-arginine translocase subunit TatC [Ilumatobacteraceae bacterium]